MAGPKPAVLGESTCGVSGLQLGVLPQGSAVPLDHELCSCMTFIGFLEFRMVGAGP